MTGPRALLDWPLELLSLLLDHTAAPDRLTIRVDVPSIHPGDKGTAVAVAEAESPASTGESEPEPGDEVKPDPLEALVGVDSFATSCKTLRAVVEAKDARWWAGVLLPFEIGIPTHLAATIGPEFLRDLLLHRHCTEPCNFVRVSPEDREIWHDPDHPLDRFGFESSLVVDRCWFFVPGLRSATHAAAANPGSASYPPIGLPPDRILFGPTGPIYLDGRTRLREDFRQLAISGAQTIDGHPAYRHPLAISLHVNLMATLATRPSLTEIDIAVPAPDNAPSGSSDLQLRATNALGVTIIDVIRCLVDGFVLTSPRRADLE